MWNRNGPDHSRDRCTWAAQNLLQGLAGRVGAIQTGEPIPRAIQQPRWSPLNVPLIWAAAGDEAKVPVGMVGGSCS